MEYKFRGKVFGTGVWVVGNLLQRYDSFGPLPLIEVQDKETFEIQIYQVIPETVGMWTGLKDKKGKDIYDGDVVGKGNGEIFWNDSFCQFQVRWHERVFRSVRGMGGEKLFSNSEIVWTVIGNIHDNPELLTPLKGERINTMHTDPAAKQEATNEQVTELESAAQDQAMEVDSEEGSVEG